MRPEVFAATAESSPSILPLTAMTPDGTPTGARKKRHAPNAARPASSSPPATIRRGRSLRVGAAGSGALTDAGVVLALSAGPGAAVVGTFVWPFAPDFFRSNAGC